VFRLAVVIIKAGVEGKAADPVVYVSGGPGALLTSRAGLIAKREAAVVAPDRDLILVDQRGSGRSESAQCPADQRTLSAPPGPGVEIPLPVAPAQQPPPLLALLRDLLQGYKCVTQFLNKRYMLILMFCDYAVER